MSTGMAEVIAAHQKRSMGMSGDSPDTCKCRVKVYPTDGETYIEERRDTAFAAHVAEELAKAGYGNVQEALLAVADEMPIETLGGADKASVWLRQRAHSLDPKGRALVQAIHDRKAEA